MTAYLDSNVFVYAALDSGKKGLAAEHILKAVQDGRLDAITSALTFDEVAFIVGKHRGQPASIAAGEALLSLENLVVAEVTRHTISEACTAMREFELMPRDAIHYATMKINRIEHIISEDRDFDCIKTIKRHAITGFKKM